MKEARLCGPSLPVITGAQTETGGILCNVDSLWKDCANRRATRNELRTAVECSVSSAKKPQLSTHRFFEAGAKALLRAGRKCCFQFQARTGKKRRRASLLLDQAPGKRRLAEASAYLRRISSGSRAVAQNKRRSRELGSQKIARRQTETTYPTAILAWLQGYWT